MPPGVLFGQFWAPASECPKECFLSAFWRFLGQKTPKSTLWGTPRQVPKTAQKALRGALSGPGPKSTPVNGGRDRNANALEMTRFNLRKIRLKRGGLKRGHLASEVRVGPRCFGVCPPWSFENSEKLQLIGGKDNSPRNWKSEIGDGKSTNINFFIFGPHPKHPILGPQKKKNYVPHLLGKDAKRGPT